MVHLLEDTRCPNGHLSRPARVSATAIMLRIVFELSERSARAVLAVPERRTPCAAHVWTLDGRRALSWDANAAVADGWIKSTRVVV